MPGHAGTRPSNLPAQGWLGLLLVAVFWPLNWLLPGTPTAYLFSPLWLGYILAMDALVLRRTGTSIWTRSRRDFVLLFVASSPVWWIFEVINRRTGNWEYVGSGVFSNVEYYTLCTIAFSTVMPAVFETAEWIWSFPWLARFKRAKAIRPTAALNLGIFLTGILMILLMVLWPRYCYPFVWTSLALILEAVNRWLGRPNLLDHLKSGDWRPIIALALGALVCGFFWEMWNYYSHPKWVYHTPGAEFWKIFEMPLLGYGGYIPFALELYGLKNLLWPRGTVLRF